MTAAEVIVLRTGEQDYIKAERYAKIAELKVREFLRYNEEESVSRFASTVAEIGIQLYQRDRQAETLGDSALRSSSFSEGNVSESKTYLTASDLVASYDAQVGNLLDGIKRYRRARVVNLNADTE